MVDMIKIVKKILIIQLLVFFGIALLISLSDSSFAAEDDKDSGEFCGVPYRITNDYKLIIGEADKEYYFESESGTYPWDSYSSEIKSVSVLGDVYASGSLDYMFTNFYNVTKIDVSHLDTRDVTSMSYMFKDCMSLKALDLRSFDVEKVENMSYMFCSCSSLNSLRIDFNSYNVTDMSNMFGDCEKLTAFPQTDNDFLFTNSVTNMEGMFQHCYSLKTATMAQWSWFDTSNVTNMSEMFLNCKSLKTLDLSCLDTAKVKDMSEMFGGCENLELLDVSGFNTNSVNNMGSIFNDCIQLENICLGRKSLFNENPPVDETHWVRYKTLSGDSCLSPYLNDLSTYKGTYPGYYVIRKDLYNSQVITKESVPYKAGGVKPSVTVKDYLNYYPAKKLKKGVDYTVSYKNYKKIGKAEITVKGKGRYYGTNWGFYRVVPNKVSIKKSKAKRLKSGKTLLSFKIRDKYKKRDYYQVLVSSNKTFKKYKDAFVKPKYVKKGKLRIKGKMKKGKKYYIKMRSCKKVGKKIYRGPWSNSIAVRGK